MRCSSPHKIRMKMVQLWPKRKQSRSNGDIYIFLKHLNKKKMETHVWYSPKDNGDTQDICVTFTQRQFHSGTVPLRKRGKKMWQSTKQG